MKGFVVGYFYVGSDDFWGVVVGLVDVVCEGNVEVYDVGWVGIVLDYFDVVVFG